MSATDPSSRAPVPAAATEPAPRRPAPGDGWGIDDLGPDNPPLRALLDNLRIAFIFVVLTPVTLLGIPAQWVSVKLGLPSRRYIPQLYHRIILALLGVKVTVKGAPAGGRPLLILANHASWLDIPVVGSLTPLFFVAKSEVAGWPLIGILAKLQRTVFVDRQRRHATGDVNKEIARRLHEGDPVVLFAEGTSSDGNRVLPFRSALVGAAKEAFSHTEEVMVQPLAIAYTRLQGVPMGRAHRGIAAWFGDMDLGPHLLEVARQGAIDVTVTYGTPAILHGGHDRKSLTLACEDEVRALSSAALAGREGA